MLLEAASLETSILPAGRAEPHAVRAARGSGSAVGAIGLGALALAAGIVAFLASPKLGLLSFGIALAPLLVIAPDKAVLLVFAAVPFDSISSLGPPGTLTLTRTLGLAVMAGWVVNMLLRRQRPRFGTPGYLLLAFIAFAALSSIWAEDRSQTFTQLTLVIQLFVLYLMIVNVITSPVALERALDILLLSTAVLAVLVIWQFPSAEAFERAQLHPTVSLGQQKFNPNALGATLVLPALAAAALGRRRGALGRWRLAVLLPIGIAAIMIGARGAAFGLVAGLAALAVLRPQLRIRLAAVVFCGIAGLAIMMPRAALERLEQRYLNSVEDRGSGRVDIWMVGMSMIRDKPLQGTGFAGFGPAFYRYMLTTDVDPAWANNIVNRYGRRGAHNSYLATLAELGVFGAGLFAAALGAHLLSAWQAFRRATKDRQQGAASLALALVGMLVGLLVIGITGDILLNKWAWVVLALTHAVGLTLNPIRSYSP